MVTDPQARYYGIAVSERTLLPGKAAQLSKTRFEDWLREAAKQPAKKHAAQERTEGTKNQLTDGTPASGEAGASSQTIRNP